MPLPDLSPEQRAAALEKAAAARKARAELRERLKSKGATVGDVLKQGETDEVIGIVLLLRDVLARNEPLLNAEATGEFVANFVTKPLAEQMQLLALTIPPAVNEQLVVWLERFFRLFARNQWKRERLAPSFHLDDKNLDPKTWCRFPILSGNYDRELAEMRGAYRPITKGPGGRYTHHRGIYFGFNKTAYGDFWHCPDVSQRHESFDTKRVTSLLLVVPYSVTEMVCALSVTRCAGRSVIGTTKSDHPSPGTTRALRATRCGIATPASRKRASAAGTHASRFASRRTRTKVPLPRSLSTLVIAPGDAMCMPTVKVPESTRPREGTTGRLMELPGEKCFEFR